MKKQVKKRIATYWVVLAVYRPSLWSFIKRRRLEIHTRHWVGCIEGEHEMYKLEQDLVEWYDKGTIVKILGINKIDTIKS